MRTNPLPAGVVLLLSVSLPLAAAVSLVRDGEPVARIVVLPSDDACLEAARELQHYITLMSGATLPVAARADVTPRAGGPAVFIGLGMDADSIADEAAREALGRLRPDGFLVQVRESGAGAPCVLVAGQNVDGMWFGVYELLESLGCRWFMPGDLGEHVPRQATVLVEDKLEVQNPDFVLRNFWWGYGGRPAWQKEAYAVWRRRNRMGGVRAGMGHNLHRIISPAEFGQTNPELFPLRDGARYVPTSREQGWQPCTSNPKVIEIAARKAVEYFDADPAAYSFSLSPADGYGWCECELCRAQDPPESRGQRQRGMGRRMSLFANAVAERLAARHADKYVCWYAYAGAVEAPEDVGVHPNVVISLAHYGWCGCNIHALAEPDCKLNTAFRKILDDWSAKGGKLFIREYWTTLVSAADMPARVCAAYSLAEDIPFLQAKGAIGFSSEAVPDYGACALNFWLAARLMWDADADTAALLRDYYDGMYGPASSAMQGYFEGIVATCRARGHRGAFFTDDELAQMSVVLDQASSLCTAAKQRERVQLTRTGLDFCVRMRDYVQTPTGAKRQALVATVHALRDDHSLAVDDKSFLSRLGRDMKADAALAAGLRGLELVPLSTAPMPPAAVNSALTIRGRHRFVLLLAAGQRLSGRVEVRRLGRYLSGGAFALVSPSGATLAEGVTAVGEPGTFAVDVAENGVHVLVVNTGSNAARVYADTRYLCLAGRSLALLGGQPAAYVCLEPNAKEGRIALESASGGTPEAPGETAAMTVCDPGGAEILSGDTTSGQPVAGTLVATPSSRGKAWRVDITRAPRGVLEDMTLLLGDGTAPYVATHPSRLLVPSDE